MARLLLLAASILALLAMGCRASVEEATRSPVGFEWPVAFDSPVAFAKHGVEADPEGMWAFTEPGELPQLVVAKKPTDSLPLEHTDVAAVVHGHVARVRVTQTFRNDRNHAIEVVYTFPLPENAAVHAMRMIIGKQVIESEIQTRAAAEKTYATARAAGHTAALLEQERPNIFTQSVANIPPGEAIEVEIEYLQTLSRDGNLYEFVFPMVVGPRFIPGEARAESQGTGWAADTDRVPDASRITPPIISVRGKGERSGNDVSLTIDVHAGSEVPRFVAPTHTVVGVPTPEGFSARLADAETIPNRDFVLRWRAGSDKPEATLFLGPADEGKGHFALVVQPPTVDLDATVGRREMIFVIDCSGSMNGVPLALAKQTLRAALAELRPVDTFNVVRFESAVGELFESSRPANEQNLVLAERFIDDLHAGGGTHMANAIEHVLGPRVPAGHNRYVFFVTDGYIGNEHEIFSKAEALVQRAHEGGGRARVFGVGIGSSPNRHLISGISRAGDAIPLYVSNREHPRAVVDHYYHLVDHPVLENLTLDWGGLEVTRVYPGGSSGAPDLFASHAVVLLGRYRGKVSGAVTLRAVVAGTHEQVELPVTVLDSREDDRTLSTLWAREAVAELEVAGWSGELDRPEVERRITELGLRYRLVTAYTSLVAVDRSRVVSDGNPELIIQAVDAAEDVDMEMAAPSHAVVKDGVRDFDAAVEIVVEAVPVSTRTESAMAISMADAKNLPVGASINRDFTAVVDIAPTASRDAAGYSMAGTTGAESKYTIEGADVTNPAFGTVGATMVQEFVQEVDILESGYEAKYGGAAGGQIAVRRVSGTNRLWGTAGVRVSPRLLAPRLIESTDEALRVNEINDVEAQLFALISGPLRRDRLFFTLGVSSGGARSHLNQSFYRTDADGSSHKFAEQRFATGRINFSYLVGLDWRITPRHELRLTAHGGPEFQRTAYRLPHGLEPNAFGNPRIDPLGGGSRVGMGMVNDHFGTNLGHVTSAALGYEGRAADDRVEISANLGFSQFVHQDAWRLDDPRLRELPATQWTSNRGLDLRTLLEHDSATELVPGLYDACESDSGETVCPVRTWLSGGLGEIDRDVTRRVGADLGLTHYLDLLGYHQLGYGGAVVWNQRQSRFRYSGANDPDFYSPDSCPAGHSAGGEYCFDPERGEYAVGNSIRVNNNRLILIDGDAPDQRTTWGFGRARREFEDLRPITDSNGQGVRAPAYDETLSSFDYAVYLQDKWALMSNLFVVGGVRWELQDMRDIYGKSRALIWDNVAPRIGIVYDWTDQGRSRLYAHYGHYYQPLPLQLGSRMFGGLIHVARSYSASDCENQTTTVDGVSHPRVTDREQPSEWCVDQPTLTTSAGAVVPRLRGQFNRQWQLGYEHEVIDDLVIGVRWLHSSLGRAVEDISPNGGLDMILANPGVGDGRFPRPTRNFDAWTVQLQKRLSKNWMLIASYTYSRLIGNYEGFVDPVSGAINLGASTQYDDPELIRNSYGPLAGNIPHRLKLDGFYLIDLRRAGRMILAASLRAQSGAPISFRVESTLPSYRGAYVNYLLPRGAGGRIDPNYQLDLGLTYAYPLPREFELEFGVRVLNVTNAKATLRVDEIYSYDAAKPIAGGDLDDLAHAKRSDGFFAREIVRPQGNFGVATRFQQPLAAQFELRLNF